MHLSYLVTTYSGGRYIIHSFLERQGALVYKFACIHSVSTSIAAYVLYTKLGADTDKQEMAAVSSLFQLITATNQTTGQSQN
jgi:hypothetical protein